MQVIGIGDNVCDRYEHQKIAYPGGQALNFAVYASMLGVPSAFLGVFGTDTTAQHVMETLDRHSVDRRRCRQVDGENGYARVTLDGGDRIFLGSNKGGVLREHPLDLSPEDLAYIRTFSLCHTSNNSYIDSQLPKLRQTGVPISYDFSGQWAQPGRIGQVAPYIDFAFLSCGNTGVDQIKALCRELSRLGVGIVTATRGSRGALLYDGGDFYVQPPKTVEAVDTLGAGDSFAAAFLLSWTANRSRAEEEPSMRPSLIRQALEEAAAFSARTCLVHGAFGEGMPF